MRIVALSCTHMAHDVISVPDGDILIIAGDATFMGRVEEISSFNRWLGQQKHKHKIFVAGNHDWLFEKQGRLAQDILTNAIYLQDSLVTIDGFRIYGSPWQPEFNNWAFNLPRNGKELKRVWSKMPERVDVLVTHCPPYGICDATAEGHCGDELLAKRVRALNPRVHIFGHIHSGYGAQEKEETLYVNGCIMNEEYEPVNDPVVIDVDKRRAKLVSDAQTKGRVLEDDSRDIFWK